MRIILIAVLSSLSLVGFAQEPFEKDGKWGLSKYGDANDSIIFRASYDEVKVEVTADGYFAYGLKDKTWYPMTKSKLLNQQGYEEIYAPLFNSDVMVAQRDGYIDIISIDESDFILRNVQATSVIDPVEFGITSEYLMTKNEKSFGLVSLKLKKEIIKAKYSSIWADQGVSEGGWLFAATEGKTEVYDYEGNKKFDLESEELIVSMQANEESLSLFLIMSDEGSYGMYNSKAKWLVDPLYIDAIPFEGSDEVVIITGKKGDGLYFNGKLLLEPAYITIDKSSERGYLAVAVGKKGEFLLDPEGGLTPVTEE
jgi:hypothetical protein